jgi:hypothetical protein
MYAAPITAARRPSPAHRLAGCRYRERGKGCARHVIGADEHGDVHEGVGAEQGFCLPVELVVGAVLDRQSRARW